MLTLRWYQQESIHACYDYLRANPGRAPCIVLPTGAGKSAVMSQICADAVAWGGRAMVVAHVKELLEQGAATTKAMFPHLDVGVYSAGLGRRETGRQVTYAGIQSVFRRPELFGGVNILLVDEAHLVPPRGDGMYQSLLDGIRQINPHVCLVGLTATPYRTQTGYVCDAEFGPLHDICYEVDVARLVEEGYLCRLTSFAGTRDADLSSVKIVNGDFHGGQLSDAMCDDELVEATVFDLIARTLDRHSVLVFSCSVAHGYAILERLHKASCGSAAMVSGETPKDERAELIADFKSGRLKYLINCMVLTTGFDAPNIDCVALVRPTISPGLYYQMVGRGFRLHDSKKDCLVLDYGGNIMRHGPVDDIRIKDPKKRSSDSDGPLTKTCPECRAIVPLNLRKCNQCDEEFNIEDSFNHDAVAADASPLSNYEIEMVDVMDVVYRPWTKRNANPEAKRTMRVDYVLGLNDVASEWICVEHSGFAGDKARRWWSARSNDPMPADVDQAVALARAGSLAWTNAVQLKYEDGKKYPEILGYDVGDKPVAVGNVPEAPRTGVWFDEEDIPF